MKSPLTKLVPIFLLCAMNSSTTVLLAESRKNAEAEGAVLFRDKGCTFCHGVNLLGTPKAPSLTNVRKTMSAHAVESQIENGGQNMPPFGDSLSHDEIDRLVLYLRAKHRPSPPPMPPPASVPNPEQ
jgi:mono/diheme cytochrome c family protein